MLDLKQDNSANAPEERMVREYLLAELEPQVGRAEMRFRQMLAQTDPVISQPSPRGGMYISRRMTGWSIGLVGAALAASLGALWAGPSLRQAVPAASDKPQVVERPVVSPTYVEHRTDSQTFDDGMLIAPDNTPMRVLRRHDMDRTRWFDKDQKLTREEVVPEDHVIYVKVKTY